MAVRILLVLVAFAVLCGCGQASPPAGTQGKKTSEEGPVAVGKTLARANLEPLGDSGTSGTAVFKEVGNLGIQVELRVSGLPAKAPNASYYAQVHEGSCSDERGGEHEEHGTNAGPALALLRLGQLLADTSGLQAHGGHEEGLPEVPFGSIEQPISFNASADGTSTVTSLLKGVKAKRLTSEGPEYIHLHGAGSGNTRELACGDLAGASRQG